jgi:hypothetical protein
MGKGKPSQPPWPACPKAHSAPPNPSARPISPQQPRAPPPGWPAQCAAAWLACAAAQRAPTCSASRTSLRGQVAQPLAQPPLVLWPPRHVFLNRLSPRAHVANSQPRVAPSSSLSPPLALSRFSAARPHPTSINTLTEQPWRFNTPCLDPCAARLCASTPAAPGADSPSPLRRSCSS